MTAQTASVLRTNLPKTFVRARRTVRALDSTSSRARACACARACVRSLVCIRIGVRARVSVCVRECTRACVHTRASVHHGGLFVVGATPSPCTLARPRCPPARLPACPRVSTQAPTSRRCETAAPRSSCGQASASRLTLLTCTTGVWLPASGACLQSWTATRMAAAPLWPPTSMLPAMVSAFLVWVEEEAAAAAGAAFWVSATSPRARPRKSSRHHQRRCARTLARSLARGR